LRITVGALTAPIVLKTAFGKVVPDDASVDLIHLESESKLAKNITLREAGVHERDTMIFVYEEKTLDTKSICQIIRLQTGKLG